MRDRFQVYSLALKIKDGTGNAMDNAFEKEVWKGLHLLWLKINSDKGSDAEVLNTYPSVFQTAPISSLREQ